MIHIFKVIVKWYLSYINIIQALVNIEVVFHINFVFFMEKLVGRIFFGRYQRKILFSHSNSVYSEKKAHISTVVVTTYYTTILLLKITGIYCDSKNSGKHMDMKTLSLFE